MQFGASLSSESVSHQKTILCFLFAKLCFFRQFGASCLFFGVVLLICNLVHTFVQYGASSWIYGASYIVACKLCTYAVSYIFCVDFW